MRLESGPAKADRNWQIVRSVLFMGFALYFVYDGAIGWPAANRREAEKMLQARPFDGRLQYDQLQETPTKPQFENVKLAAPFSQSDLRAQLGEPTLVEDNDEYYVSRYGFGKATIRAGRVKAEDMLWKEWKYPRDKVISQFYWAILPALPGLYFLWRLYKAATLRVVIDDDGMTYDGKPIPFDKMVALRDYNPKGWIDLYHQTASGQKKLRLDNEKVMKFDEIVAAICAAKGFPNEVTDYHERKAREEARKEEAVGAELDESGETPEDTDRS